MDSFTFDCSQLNRVDWAKMPTPAPLKRVAPRRMDSTSKTALQAALSFGKSFNNTLSMMDDLVSVANKPPRARLIPPPPPVSTPAIPAFNLKFSSSGQLTGAIAGASSLSAAIGVVSSLGFYASSTREVGAFVTLGGGIWLNSPGAAVGLELTVILGTPADLSGLYFGIGIGVGTGVAITDTLLFSPTLPLTNPMTLTLMGISVNLSAVTPTRLPVTIALEVTDTKIKPLLKF